MEEKDMVLDVLNTTKSSLSSYATVIMECSTENVRQTFQNMRDCDEQFQYNLFKIAEQKGYYQTPQEASMQEKQDAKTTLTQS